METTTMKSVTFERIDDCETTKTRGSMFSNRIEYSIGNNMDSSNDHYFLMNSRSEIHPRIDNMVMIEAKRLVMNEKINTARWKREQELLDAELKEFQNKLLVTRPKFTASHINSDKRSGPSIHDKKRDGKIPAPPKTKLDECDKVKINSAADKNKDKDMVADCYKSVAPTVSPLNSGSITIVIKDKPVISCQEENLEIKRWVINSLRNHVSEAKRLREVKAKIQRNIITGKLRRFFNAWRDKVRQSKKSLMNKRDQDELRDVKKIELFVNSVKEKQKILGKNETGNKAMMKNKLNTNDQITEEAVKIVNSRKNFINPAEPLNNRLKVQKKIIAEQKIKLAEQNRLIEEMKLKQIEAESKIGEIKTINLAKTVLNKCGLRPRRPLMTQIIQASDIDDDKIVKSSATFPGHSEARATARKEKIRQRQIEHQKKLYEEKLKEEAMKLVEERKRKQSQRNAEREAKLIREEQERKKAENTERTRINNELADEFHRRLLLRNYIVKPLKRLVQDQWNRVVMATRYHNLALLRKTFITWKNEVKQQFAIRMELSICVHERNLLWKCFHQWRETTKNEIRAYQVACDFYDLRLVEKYLKIWIAHTVEIRLKNIENEKKSAQFYKKLIKKNCFIRWKTYMTIIDVVKESDKRRDQWRQLVQTVIPDFAPRYRGVLIDD